MMTTLAGHRLQPRLAVLLPIVFCSIVCTGIMQAGPRTASPNGKVDSPNGSLPESSSELRDQISRLEQLILQQNEALTELKAKLNRQQVAIDSLQAQRNLDTSPNSDFALPLQLASLTATPLDLVSLNPPASEA